MKHAPFFFSFVLVQQMAVAVKKDGSLRICLDARDLNKAVIPEHYALPTAEDIFNCMHGAKFFKGVPVAVSAFGRRGGWAFEN